VTVTGLPTIALAGALTEKWVAAAAFATPAAKNEIGTATSAAATTRAYRPTRVFARAERRRVVRSLIDSPAKSEAAKTGSSCAMRRAARPIGCVMVAEVWFGRKRRWRRAGATGFSLEAFVGCVAVLIFMAKKVYWG